MYWRGETFYTANEIYSGPYDERTVFLGDKNQENLKDYIGRNRGKRMFFIVERTRLDTLRSLLPEEARASLRVLEEPQQQVLPGGRPGLNGATSLRQPGQRLPAASRRAAVRGAGRG